jgi:energy-coupling factor transporter ATP-binding protein EcfA2
VNAVPKPPLRIVSSTPSLPASFTSKVVSGYARSREVLAVPVAWVWHGYIASTHAVELCGATGDGKSTLAALMAAALAATPGEPVKLLGREVTPMALGKQALLVNEENGERSAVAGIDRAIEVLGLSLEQTWDRIALLSRAGVRAGWDDGETEPGALWPAIVKGAKAGMFGAIFLDTRAKIFAGFGESKDEGAQANASTMITKLVDVARCPVIVLSHPPKAETSGTAAVSGSVQRAAGADAILFVSARRSEGRVVESTVTLLKQRDDDGEDWPSAASFSLVKRGGVWTLTEGEGSAEGASEPAVDRIVKLLASEGELTQRQIRDQLKLNNETVSKSLNALDTLRRVRRRTVTIGGRARVVFKHTETFAELCKPKGRRDE